MIRTTPMSKTTIVPRIGIFAGTFDPVHAGHIAFALQALSAATLDMVYFMPERRPRSKETVEHFGHRMAMLRRAIEPHVQLGLLDLVDINFSVQRTLPRLIGEFPGSQLVFLMGSDVVARADGWPHVAQLFKSSELVVGVRADDTITGVKNIIGGWREAPIAVTLFTSFAPAVSSKIIRQALRSRTPAQGLLPSVQRYSDRHWLYVSLS